MPPKVRQDSKPKSKKAAAHMAVMEKATADGQKMFKQHEIQRVKDEHSDKTTRDRTMLDITIEKDRLRKDIELLAVTLADTFEEERLAFDEHEKHLRWKRVPVASRLPDVDKECEINTFLSVWREKEEEHGHYKGDTVVIASRGPNDISYAKLFIRPEQGLPASKQVSFVDEELHRCLEAYQLCEFIKEARDRAWGNPESIAHYNASLCRVYDQVLRALDTITINALMYYDIVIGDTETETIMKLTPEDQPIFKYGLWVKIKEMTRSFTSLVFPDIEVRLDPKSNANPKLPKMLGLSKENVAVRAMQTAFDPKCGFNNTGKEYYALNCTLQISLLNFSDRPKKAGEWLIRGQTELSHELHEQEYPPRKTEARTEDPMFRVSFDVPSTLVIRQPSLLIGKWVPETLEWEPCSHTVFGATFGGTSRVEANPRRATFVTNELQHFAVLQEKVFDVPYEFWSLKPLSYDQVLITLEGQRRGDASDRRFRILVQDAFCKLLAPDDEELEKLRSNWVEPVTLFRELAHAGFNFILEDEDSVFLQLMIPKTAALEAKAYADIAQLCQYYTIAGTKHNKCGEDPEMALFRMSKSSRAVDEEVPPTDGVQIDDADCYNIRYRRDNCVLSAYTETQEHPNLNVLEGHETHHNLYTMLLPLEGEDHMRTLVDNTNYLLRRCIRQLLQLVRPLSWG